MSTQIENPQQLSNNQIQERISAEQATAMNASKTARRVGLLVGLASTAAFGLTSLVPKLRPYGSLAMIGSIGASVVGAGASEYAAGKQEQASRNAAPLQEEKFKRQVDRAVANQLQPQAA